jgi:hypothetical protein
MKFWTLIFTIIPVTLLLVGIDVVEAQTPPRTLIDMDLGGSSTGRPNIVAYLNSLFAVALGLAAIIAVIKIIIAGVKYMLSDVVTNKASAKDDIKNALLGLIILLAVFLILYTINPNLTRLDIFTRLQQLPSVSAPANNGQTVSTPGNTTTGGSNTSGVGSGGSGIGSGGSVAGSGSGSSPQCDGINPIVLTSADDSSIPQTHRLIITAICPDTTRFDILQTCRNSGGINRGVTSTEVRCLQRID